MSEAVEVPPVPISETPAVVEVAVEAVVAPVKTPEELAQIAKADEEKRQARALKFGIEAPAPALDSKDARAKRFGTGEAAPVKVSSGLDSALGSGKREKKGKGAKVEGATAPVKTAPVKAAKVVDPELAKKIAAEEEKKAKRVARFAPAAAAEPAEKKTKIDV